MTKRRAKGLVPPPSQFILKEKTTLDQYLPTHSEQRKEKRTPRSHKTKPQTKTQENKEPTKQTKQSTKQRRTKPTNNKKPKHPPRPMNQTRHTPSAS
jgi:hypothetical protein